MSTDLVIFLIVVGLRLGVPLLIFRYPLPAIFAALVIDAADQTIFQAYTDLNLDGYQGYDKALDVYYLAIAYLSTFRNWADPFAARVAQCLWYYRLVGVVAFELTQTRALLLIFPNTFEYFFIAYEVIRVAWDPRRLSHRAVIGLAAFIWIFIKLPQEWWIHIAQLDFTDFMKEDVFGGSATDGWGELIGDNLWFIGLIAVLVVAVVWLFRWAVRTAPEPDWPPSVDIERHLQSTRVGVEPATVKLWEWDLLEKAILCSLISIIFGEVIPNMEATPWQMTFGVTFVVVGNTVVSQWMARRGHSWASTASHFGAMAVVNAGLATFYVLFLRRGDDPVNGRGIFFFVLLIALIITLYDRYRPLRAAGYGDETPAPEPEPVLT